MAGCDTKNLSGDYNRGIKKVLRWVAAGAALGGVLAYFNIVDAVGLVTLPPGPAWAAFGAIVFAAAAGATLGLFIGHAVEWFGRLKEQNPRTITIAGLIVCAGKNTGVPPINDNDWTFNVGADFTLEAPSLPGLDEDEILDRAAPDSGQSQAHRVVDPGHGDVPVFHTEIGSHMGDYSAVGGAVGSVAGAIAGAAVGVAICVALGIFTFGIAAAVCALIVCLAIFLGAAAGGVVGSLVGAGIGWIADKLSDFDERGEAIEEGTCMTLTGRWVTDTSHEHNEIHDIESAQVIECGVGSHEEGLKLAAAVGTGRHPTGRDP